MLSIIGQIHHNPTRKNDFLTLQSGKRIESLQNENLKIADKSYPHEISLCPSHAKPSPPAASTPYTFIQVGNYYFYLITCMTSKMTFKMTC